MIYRHTLVLLLMLLLLAGCATPTDISREEAPETVAEPEPEDEAVAEERARRMTGGELSPVAANLLASSKGLLDGGEPDAALNLAQRAHRISPDAAEVYYRIGEIHMTRGDYGRAEQFVLKGIGKAGNDEALQRSGWELLVDIRENEGDMAGAREAQERASRY